MSSLHKRKNSFKNSLMSFQNNSSLFFLFFLTKKGRSHLSELPSLSLRPTQREGRPKGSVSPLPKPLHSFVGGRCAVPLRPPQAPMREHQLPLCEHQLDRPALHSLRSPACNLSPPTILLMANILKIWMI